MFFSVVRNIPAHFHVLPDMRRCNCFTNSRLRKLRCLRPNAQRSPSTMFCCSHSLSLASSQQAPRPSCDTALRACPTHVRPVTGKQVVPRGLVTCHSSPHRPLWSKAGYGRRPVSLVGIPLWESPCGAPFTASCTFILPHSHAPGAVSRFTPLGAPLVLRSPLTTYNERRYIGT